MMDNGRHAIPALFVTACCALPLPAGAASVLLNGGFENPSVATPKSKVYRLGQRFGSWQVTGQHPFCSVTILHKNFKAIAPLVLLPKSGNQWLNMNGFPSGICGVSQTFNVAKNTRYMLSFHVGNINFPGTIVGTKTTVQVYADNKPLMSVTNAGANGQTRIRWNKYSKIVNSNASGKLKIDFRSADGYDDSIGGLDEVTVIKHR